MHPTAFKQLMLLVLCIAICIVLVIWNNTMSDLYAKKKVHDQTKQDLKEFVSELDKRVKDLQENPIPIKVQLRPRRKDQK